MSNRSILLLTTICAAFGSTAASDQAAAHGGGGSGFGGGGGGSHSAGSGMYISSPVASGFKPSVSPVRPVHVPSPGPTSLGSLGTHVNGPASNPSSIGKPYTGDIGFQDKATHIAWPNLKQKPGTGTGMQAPPQPSAPPKTTDDNDHWKGRGTAVIIAGDGPHEVDADDPDGETVCHRVKRKVVTRDGDVVLRGVKVCETVDAVQQ
jgi:hypothetical protein